MRRSAPNHTVDLFGSAHEEPRHLKRDGADVAYDAAFLPEQDANRYLAAAERLHYRQETIRVYGRVHEIPRLTAWFSKEGRTYTYSGIAMAPEPFPPFLAEINERLREATGFDFNSVLVNHYRDGNDKVGWHSDDEPELGSEIQIASVSLGGTRDFKMRRKDDHDDVVERCLEHGSLLLMRHPTQKHWEHCIPPRKRTNEPRYNLTFRRIVG